MNQQQAQARLPLLKAELARAWIAYRTARDELLEARNNLDNALQTVQGEPEYEVGYYSIRRVEPTPTRCHANGSQGGWTWAT